MSAKIILCADHHSYLQTFSLSFVEKFIICDAKLFAGNLLITIYYKSSFSSEALMATLISLHFVRNIHGNQRDFLVQQCLTNWFSWDVYISPLYRAFRWVNFWTNKRALKKLVSSFSAMPEETHGNGWGEGKIYWCSKTKTLFLRKR